MQSADFVILYLGFSSNKKLMDIMTIKFVSPEHFCGETDQHFRFLERLKNNIFPYLLKPRLKGLCHQMNNFLKVSTFFICAESIGEKIKDTVWLASMKTLTYCENPSSNPLQIACCGIQEAACDPVNCSVSRRWFEHIRGTMDYRLFQGMNQKM